MQPKFAIEPDYDERIFGVKTKRQLEYRPTTVSV
jgi:hypothetical protein